MAPFSSLFDFVAHHGLQQHGDDAIESSSSHSTFAVDPIKNMKRPLSEQTASAPAPQVPRRTKSVTFFASVKVQLIENVDQYSAEERASSWFTRSEFDAMKRERRATVKVMEQQAEIDDGQHYFRGLEFKTKKGSQLKQWNMMEATLAVLDEQMQPHEHSAEAETAIAQVYSLVVADSREAAAERGQHDQRVSLEALSSTTTAMDVSPRMPRRLSCRAA